MMCYCRTLLVLLHAAAEWGKVLNNDDASSYDQEIDNLNKRKQRTEELAKLISVQFEDLMMDHNFEETVLDILRIEPRKGETLIKNVCSNPPSRGGATGSSTDNSYVEDSPAICLGGESNHNRTRSSDSSSSGSLKPHTGGDIRWDAINYATAKENSPLGLSNFRLLKKLGYGDIGSVYLVEIRGTSTYFAMKVMDKAFLASRNKILRAHTEKDILSLLDHPFLPTLHSYFETGKFHCLVMEFCSGGNLHSLRQKQATKCFTEEATRFYAAEILLALEYLQERRSWRMIVD